MNKDNYSLFAWLGIPNEISVVVALLGLSLALAPFAGGIDFGAIKIPRFPRPMRTKAAITGIVVFSLMCAGFLPLWKHPSNDDLHFSTEAEMETYLMGLYNGNVPVEDKLVSLDDASAHHFADAYGGSIWDGGLHWGRIKFEKDGRTAYFSNTEQGRPGKILLQGLVMEYAFGGYVGVWMQQDKKGSFIIDMIAQDEGLRIVWGVTKDEESIWKRIELKEAQ